MMNVIFSLLTGVGGMVLIAVLWFAVQQLVRRNSPLIPADCDLLESMGHDCGNCSEAGACGIHRH
jgi:hypothetical protein